MTERAISAEAIVEGLVNVLGPERVSTKLPDREAHSQDESFHEPHLPDAVVWPENVREISAVLKYANAQRIPVTPWSGGSSLEGNPIPVRGGILLALYNMNRILQINEADLQVRVQPGIVYDDLNNKLARYGLFFPPAPGSSDVASIGGMVANNSSGMHAVRYGATKDYVLKMEVVLPTGEIVTLGNNAIKTTSGYDLIRLFVGSEGTLGIVTEVTLRLHQVPEKMAAIATFPSMTELAQAIYEINRYGPVPAAVEVMDADIVRLVNEYSGLELTEVPTLVIEFHGTQAGIEEEAALIEETCRDNGCLGFETAVAHQERARLWAGRKDAHNAVKHLNADCHVTIGDIVVPISRYADAVAKAYEVADKYGIRVYTFGHAGDGNLHVEILTRKDDPEEQKRGERVNAEIVRYAISVGGTATGEHGVGIGKVPFMAQEHGPALKVMQRIKRLLDPNGIMNPGKIFAEAGS
jgi:D-lactate dehydrogenase (cytochrome)